MKNLLFRKIEDDEFDKAYLIICEIVEWLHSKNIKQWTDPIPISKYKNRQNNGGNYCLAADGELAVVVSLIRESTAVWIDEIGSSKIWWISTLVTARNFQGNNLGQTAVERAKDYLRKKEKIDEVFLDCAYGNGFLPNFYKSLHFHQIYRKDIAWPKCGPTDMVLMKCTLKE
ncbi:MAG: GNAT family N-acetyltransferase [Promethearchaeota archaeon]